MGRKKKASAPPWVPLVRLALVVGFVLGIVDVILTADTAPALGIGLRFGFAAVLLAVAVVLHRLYPEKAPKKGVSAARGT